MLIHPKIRNCFLATVFVATACATSTQKASDLSWSERISPSDELNDVGSTEVVPAASAVLEQPTLFVVRHDGRITNPSAKDTSCECLTVRVSNNPNEGFQWEKDPPWLRGDALIVSILNSSSCSTNLSISGVYRVDSNVEISLEPAFPKRPLAISAVIPKPEANGKIFLKFPSASKHHPNNASKCTVNWLEANAIAN